MQMHRITMQRAATLQARPVFPAAVTQRRVLAATAAPAAAEAPAAAPAAAEAPAAAPAAAQTPRPRPFDVRMPMRPREERGPRKPEDIKSTAQAVLNNFKEGKQAILSNPSTNIYMLLEHTLVLAEVFKFEAQAEVTVRKYERKPDAEQPQQSTPGSEDSQERDRRIFYRLVAQTSAGPLSPLPEGAPSSPKSLGVRKDDSDLALGTSIADELVQNGFMQVQGIGPYSVDRMIKAVQRASVRARQVAQQQVVITSIQLQEVTNSRSEQEGRAPAKSVVLQLRLRPLPARNADAPQAAFA